MAKGGQTGDPREAGGEWTGYMQWPLKLSTQASCRVSSASTGCCRYPCDIVNGRIPCDHPCIHVPDCLTSFSGCMAITDDHKVSFVGCWLFIWHAQRVYLPGRQVQPNHGQWKAAVDGRLPMSHLPALQPRLGDEGGNCLFDCQLHEGTESSF